MLLEILGDGSGFKVRAAGVVIRDGRVLVHSNLAGDRWMLPGGGVEFGETASEAATREFREELGVEANVGRLLWLVEHFFETPRRQWHQIAWIYEVTLPEGCDALLRDTWPVEEAEGPVTFRWVPLTELHELPLIPGFLRDALADLPAEPCRVAHVDSWPPVRA